MIRAFDRKALDRYLGSVEIEHIRHLDDLQKLDVYRMQQFGGIDGVAATGVEALGGAWSEGRVSTRNAGWAALIGGIAWAGSRYLAQKRYEEAREEARLLFIQRARTLKESISSRAEALEEHLGTVRCTLAELRGLPRHKVLTPASQSCARTCLQLFLAQGVANQMLDVLDSWTKGYEEALPDYLLERGVLRGAKACFDEVDRSLGGTNRRGLLSGTGEARLVAQALDRLPSPTDLDESIQYTAAVDSRIRALRGEQFALVFGSVALPSQRTRASVLVAPELRRKLLGKLSIALGLVTLLVLFPSIASAITGWLHALGFGALVGTPLVIILLAPGETSSSEWKLSPDDRKLALTIAAITASVLGLVLWCFDCCSWALTATLLGVMSFFAGLWACEPIPRPAYWVAVVAIVGVAVVSGFKTG